MKHVYRLSAGLLIYLVVICCCRSGKKTECAAETKSFDPTTVQAIDLFPGHGGTPAEKEAYFSGIKARTKKLSEMEEERVKRGRAATAMTENRKVNRERVRSAWTAFLKANMAKYEALHHRAETEANHQTPCTICDGLSYTPCLMCHDHNGYCLSCLGSGKKLEDYCPTCSGNGKCYLCSGAGKMLCPFCNDGTIEANGRPPVEIPPIE